MTKIETLPTILTPKDVQAFLGMHKDLIYKLFKSKSFPSTRIGTKHIITKAKFLKWYGIEEVQN